MKKIDLMKRTLAMLCCVILTFSDVSPAFAASLDTGVNGIETVDFTGECTADDNGHGTRMAQAIEKAAGGKADILSLKGLLESLPIAAAASHAAKSEAYFTDKSDFSEAKADYLDILNMVYPVGIYYRSAVNKSPAKFLGDMG